MFKGINASPGVAIGKAFLLKKTKVEANKESIESTMIDDELKKLADAVAISKNELEVLQKKTAQELSEEEAQVFVAHAMFLDDPEFIGAVQNKIKDELVCAAWAMSEVTASFVTMFEGMDDEYFKERASDVGDVGERVLRHILGIDAPDLSNIDENTIVIAEDLTPSDTATMDKSKVIGFATDIGGRTSHTAIMARSLEIPAVLGLKDITAHAKTGDIIAVNGLDGTVFVNPDEEKTKEINRLKTDYEARQAKLAQLKDVPSVSKDGHHVELSCNIGTPEDVQGALKYGADGVGLYRTEFLYMNASQMPDEQTQFEAYKTVLENMGEKPVIIRTLDIGGDKKLPYLNLPDEMNPFLGVRAIRLCFKEVELFKTQLKAILRAAKYGNCHVMFPMISNIDEVRRAKQILEECKTELDEQGVEYGKDLKVGIMVEIPSAAVTADIIAKEVDFFSIGTNDLCQYTLAVDRMNERIANLYDPYNPAILRLVKHVIDAANQNGIFAGMCGEMAGEEDASVLLLGLGLHEFSMSASSILKIKEIITSASYEKAKELAEKALACENSQAVLELVKAFRDNL